MPRDHEQLFTAEPPKTVSDARRRALRAARVVTLGLALAGCPESHQPRVALDAELALNDAGVESDAGVDSDAGVERDAGVDSDAGVLADAGSCGDLVGAAWEGCCQTRDWDPDAGCLAWGPYVPPGATMPESRTKTSLAALTDRPEGRA